MLNRTNSLLSKTSRAVLLLSTNEQLCNVRHILQPVRNHKRRLFQIRQVKKALDNQIHTREDIEPRSKERRHTRQHHTDHEPFRSQSTGSAPDSLKYDD
jgi:hypothetical protein